MSSERRSGRLARRSTRALLVAPALSLLLVTIPEARAEPPPRPPPPSAEALAGAKDLFNRGLALLDARDPERALDYFLRSRALVPGKGNTSNAAHCLGLLGRDDEALELYEELTARFSADLDEPQRARLPDLLARLRARVGRVSISANASGAVVIDGRARGRLPLEGALRVTAGEHVVRVLADGYEPFEAVVRVEAGGQLAIDARLRPLADSGRLRLEDDSGAGADVFVDGVKVGSAPWEGTLGPGPHVVWTRLGDRGSAPSRAVVVQGQTATLALRSVPLGPPVTLEVEPRSAEVLLDAVALGRGLFRERLPVGAHEVRAFEVGYRERAERFVEPEASGDAPHATLVLEVDPTHPRWPRHAALEVRVEILGGAALGLGLRGDADAWSVTSRAAPPALGGVALGRLGLHFPSGIGVELTGGYLALGASLSRSRATSFTSAGARRAITYRLDDDLGLSGPIAGATFVVRRPLGGHFVLTSRLTAGVFVEGARDPISGRAVTSEGSAPLVPTERSQRLISGQPFVEPEVALGARLGGFELALGLGFFAVPTEGPRFSHDALEVQPAGCSRAHPAAPACAPASAIVAGERAHGAFGAFIPGLSLGHGL